MREMRFQPGFESPVRASLTQLARIGLVGIEISLAGRDYRLFFRQRTGFFESCRQLACLDLGGLDVRLVERVDAENGASHCGRHFEAEEFLPDMLDRFDDDANHRMAGLFQRVELFVMTCVVFARGAQVDEEAVIAIS